MPETYTASELVTLIIEKRPALKGLLPDPEICKASSLDVEKHLSDLLAKKILFLVEINEWSVTLTHVPGKGWSAGCDIPLGIQGLSFECIAGDPPFSMHAGYCLLGLLFALVDAGINPVVMDRRTWARKQELRG